MGLQEVLTDRPLNDRLAEAVMIVQNWPLHDAIARLDAHGLADTLATTRAKLVKGDRPGALMAARVLMSTARHADARSGRGCRPHARGRARRPFFGPARCPDARRRSRYFAAGSRCGRVRGAQPTAAGAREGHRRTVPRRCPDGGG